MKKPNRVFNWRHKEDSRDRIAKPRRRAEKLTRRLWPMRWRPFDQGSDPYCVGYAWAGWMRWATQWPHMQALAPWIYEGAKLRDQWPGEDYEGSSVRGGAKSLKALKSLEHYEFSTKLDTLIDRLLYDGPVVMGTNWYRDMSYPTTIDGVHWASSSGRLDGGHAYLLRGVNIKDEYVIIRNSWGDAYPRNARLSFVCLEELLAEDGEACIPTLSANHTKSCGIVLSGGATVREAA